MQLFKNIPEKLVHEKVSLFLEKTVPADAARGLVPYYHYRIRLAGDIDAGHINFRVGDSPHILNVAGHIGYEVKPEHRGQQVSYHACMAIRPLVRSVYSHVILTADPDNAASIAIIQKLGAVFLDEISVPKSDPAYAKGVRAKRRYRWDV